MFWINSIFQNRHNDISYSWNNYSNISLLFGDMECRDSVGGVSLLYQESRKGFCKIHYKCVKSAIVTLPFIFSLPRILKYLPPNPLQLLLRPTTNASYKEGKQYKKKRVKRTLSLVIPVDETYITAWIIQYLFHIISIFFNVNELTTRRMSPIMRRLSQLMKRISFGMW